MKEDSTIVACIWNRDSKGIQDLEEKYNNYLHTISYNILGDANDADECVNDVLMKVWNAIPPARPQSLKAFVGKICRNHAINQLRDSSAKKRGSGEAAIVLDELGELAENCGRDEQILDQIILSDIINRFLSSLSREERNIFLSRYWYFDSIKDIAAYAGCSESRIKSILFRCRKKLKKQLEKEGFCV